MTERFLRFALRGRADFEAPDVRERVGRIASMIGIAANVLLFALKLTVGLLFHSISVTADAVNNLADGASSVVTLFGFWLAARPADDEHPYGHARAEYLAGMVVSFLVVFLGFELGVQSGGRIAAPEKSVLSAAAFIALVFSILIKFLLSRFYRRVGGLIHSEALSAVSRDSRNDMLATLAVVLGAAASRAFGVDLDGWFGLAVAVFIVVSGVQLIRETADPLLGKAPDSDLVARIREEILRYDGVLGMHDLAVHSYGIGRVFASVHCEVDARLPLLEVHRRIDAIERDFAEKLSIRLVIHPDPVVLGDARTDALRVRSEASLHMLFPAAEIHDFRAEWDGETARVSLDLAVPFSVSEPDAALRERAEAALLKIPEISAAAVTLDRIESRRAGKSGGKS